MAAVRAARYQHEGQQSTSVQHTFFLKLKLTKTARQVKGRKEENFI